MNKMHFYYFSTFFATTNITNYTNYSCCSCYLLFTSLRPVHLVIIFFSVSFVSSVVFINIGCHGFNGFSLSFSFSFSFPSSPIQQLEPGATPCRGGRCAARYPHGPQQPANKNTLDYDVCSRRWSRTTARPCRARDGVGVIFQPDYNDLLLVNFYA